MKKLLVVLLLVSLSAQAECLGLQFERELKDKSYTPSVEASADLPEPQLVFEHTLVYKPTTRIHQRIHNGGTGIPKFTAVPESEYYKNN